MSESVRNIKGIIGVVNTPFTSENKIDTDSLERYVEHSLKCKVAGFLVLGLAAEVNKLTLDEKLLIAETVIKKTDRKVPVICSTAATSQNERINLAKELSESGCDGILVNIPFENEQSFISDVKAISDNISGFMMLQDWDFYGYGIPINIISKLFNDLENFKCLKIEVVPAGIKYSQARNATNGKLHLSGGWAGTQMIEALDRGVDAFMPTILHDVYGMIYHSHNIGKREEAKILFNKLLPIISFSHQHLDISIHFNKRLVHRQGIFTAPNVREPILTFDKYHENIADELINYAIKLGENIKKA
jgi:4-hydroxy-tetrahydrodipicolinate synthase